MQPPRRRRSHVSKKCWRKWNKHSRVQFCQKIYTQGNNGIGLAIYKNWQTQWLQDKRCTQKNTWNHIPRLMKKKELENAITTKKCCTMKTRKHVKNTGLQRGNVNVCGTNVKRHVGKPPTTTNSVPTTSKMALLTHHALSTEMT